MSVVKCSRDDLRQRVTAPTSSTTTLPDGCCAGSGSVPATPTAAPSRASRLPPAPASAEPVVDDEARLRARKAFGGVVAGGARQRAYGSPRIRRRPRHVWLQLLIGSLMMQPKPIPMLRRRMQGVHFLGGSNRARSIGLPLPSVLCPPGRLHTCARQCSQRGCGRDSRACPAHPEL
jgi:hypothetical protein